jgi:hypothetical protein
VKSAVQSCLLALVLAWAGCAAVGIDWNRQVGEMTFDQAIGLLGTPDESEKLDDGRIIARWSSHYVSGGTPTESDDTFRYQPSTARLDSSTPKVQESWLRLTFGTNLVLDGWSKD